MSTHFKWYPGEEETIVPFNATYQFPAQASKAMKTTPRIPPKNGSKFNPGSTIRLEFPAQGYINPLNTTIEFDVTLYVTAPDEEIDGIGSQVRFQNNIQSVFQRVRLLYGATPIEDIIDYNYLVRQLTEWTSTSEYDQQSIANGVGGATPGTEGVNLGSWAPLRRGLVNSRQAFVQGVDTIQNGASGAPGGAMFYPLVGTGLGTVPNEKISGNTRFSTRRYQINLALGMFNQDKLIPVKYMASQLAIELTLEQPQGCIFRVAGSGNDNNMATYMIENVNLIPEIIEFDSMYDSNFEEGLRTGGVPIKFSSWHNYRIGTGGSNTFNIAIQERSRSVKSIFTCLRRTPDTLLRDSHASLTASANVANDYPIQYQYRIGGRYYPASPVQLAIGDGSINGAEAFIELQKALNCMGDTRLSTPINSSRWGLPTALTLLPNGNQSTLTNEYDYAYSLQGFHGSGAPLFYQTTKGSDATLITNSGFSGASGSSVFCMATDLETSNGMELSGLNAEQQSDITFLASYKEQQSSSCVFEIFTYYDALLVLKENNVIDLFF